MPTRSGRERWTKREKTSSKSQRKKSKWWHARSIRSIHPLRQGVWRDRKNLRLFCFALMSLKFIKLGIARITLLLYESAKSSNWCVNHDCVIFNSSSLIQFRKWLNTRRLMFVVWGNYFARRKCSLQVKLVVCYKISYPLIYFKTLAESLSRDHFLK